MDTHKKNNAASQADEEKLFKFLALTRSGKYAPIDKGSLHYSRLNERTEEVEATQEIYFYDIV